MIAMRGQIGESKRKTKVTTLSEILVSEFGKFNKELGEGIEETLMSEASNINELNILNNLTNFIEKIPGAVKGVKDKFVDIVKSIFEKISEAFDSIKKMGAKIIDGLMDFFGFDIDEEGTSVTSTDEDFPIASLLSDE
jgi:phage-related protein